MAFKDYEDFSNTVGTTTGNVINSHFQNNYLANSGLSTTTIAAIKLGDSVLSNANCRYQHQNWMQENNCFNPDKLTIVGVGNKSEVLPQLSELGPLRKFHFKERIV